MDQQNPPQTPSTPPAGKAQGLGWIWVAVIVVIVAGILYITQKKAPAGEEQAQEETPSEEMPAEVKDIPVTPAFVSPPQSISAGTIFGIDWKVDAEEQTYASHIAVHWDTVSHPGDYGLEITPTLSGYANFTKAYASGTYAVPGTFEDNIKLDDSDAGKVLYLRAHAVVAGKNYWSDEITIPVRAIGSVGGGS